MPYTEQNALIDAMTEGLYQMSKAGIAEIVEAIADHTDWPSVRRRILLSMHDAGLTSTRHHDEQVRLVADREARRKKKDHKDDRHRD